MKWKHRIGNIPETSFVHHGSHYCRYLWNEVIPTMHSLRPVPRLTTYSISGQTNVVSGIANKRKSKPKRTRKGYNRIMQRQIHPIVHSSFHPSIHSSSPTNEADTQKRATTSTECCQFRKRSCLLPKLVFPLLLSSHHHYLRPKGACRVSVCPCGPVLVLPKRTLLYSMIFVDYRIRILERFRWQRVISCCNFLWSWFRCSQPPAR